MNQHSYPVLTNTKTRRKMRREASRVAPPRIRLLPITMMMAFLLFSVKAVEVYQGGRQIQLMMQPAFAQEEGQQAEAVDAMDDAEAEEEAPSEEMTEAEKAAKEEEMKLAKLQEQNDEILGRNNEFSQVEIDILQSLAERRNELEERSRELDLKEKLMEATELRINDKIDEIKRLEQEVSGLLLKYSEQEENHIRSLVKIYESMKPKAAAAIFNELELPILLEVIDQMSERRVAPVLAAMNPIKAKEVTADLAEMRKLKPMPSVLPTQ